MGATIINENDSANGPTYVDNNITETGSTQDQNIVETPNGGNDTNNISIENIVYPKNFCATNQCCINLPPPVVKDLENQAYFFNDVKKSNSLVKVLQADKDFKSLPQTDCSRENIITKLDILFKQWLKDEEQKRATEKDEPKTSTSSSLVIAYGSYQLGVHDEKSDLDLMCIAPRSITRDNWIQNFYTVLQEKNEIKDLQALPNQRIPRIQFKLDEIEVELAFVQLKIENIPITLDLRNDSSLVGMDKPSHRTLSAWQAADKILQMVPNEKQFLLILRAIRLWAKRNGLYGNKLGYLGGISWAILVAKTCLLYPRMDSAGLIHKFFFIYANWEWPKRVFLVDPDEPRGRFNPFSYTLHGQTYVMPIMTPPYNQENSAYNVTYSTRDRMKAAFSHAYCIIDGIMTGKATKCNLGWQTFFERTDFIKIHDYFIVVFAHSFAGAQHGKWQKHIEFKFVHFLRALEKNHHLQLKPCVDTRSYRPKHLIKGTDCSIWFVGLVNPPLSYDEDNDCYKLCSKTQEAMEYFEQLSSTQAEVKGFGNVQLQVEYMCREDYASILQSLEIRN